MILVIIPVITAIILYFLNATKPFKALVQLLSILPTIMNKWAFILSVVILIGSIVASFTRRLDYDKSILSIMRIVNYFKKPEGTIVGTVKPISHRQLFNNGRKLSLDETMLSGATLITGSTGSGKTTTMKSMIMQNIRNKKPVIFVDYKGETGILDDLKKECQLSNTPFYEFSNRACTFTYDPFANLNETGKVEALMNTRQWDASGADSHYKTSTQLALQSVIRAYDKKREETNDNKNYLVGLREFTYSYRPTANERDGFMTLQKMLDLILTSSASELFKDNPSFTFETDEPFVVCFSFVSANKSLANSLSSFLFQDVMDRGTRRPYRNKLLICVDEFGTIESSTLIKDLLEKGRSGGCQTVFSLLDINQIAMTSGEYFVNAILGTINNFIIHAGATQATADMLASVQKYEKEKYAIMDLKKPYKNIKPTALLISKYPLVGSQSVFKIEPFVEKVSKRGLSIYKEGENVEYTADYELGFDDLNPLNDDDGDGVINTFDDINNLL